MCLNLINLMTLHKDCPGQGLTKLKYKAFSSISWSGQFYFNSRTDFTSTWLYQNIFRSWIRNLDSSVLKHSELLASHHGDLKSKRCLCPYPSWATLNSRALCRWVTVRDNVLLHLTCMLYQCLHTLWLRGQPTHITHNDLYLTNIVVLINNILFDHE